VEKCRNISVMFRPFLSDTTYTVLAFSIKQITCWFCRADFFEIIKKATSARRNSVSSTS
jgi:hypothetical protein